MLKLSVLLNYFSVKADTVKGLDIEQVGTINGQSLFDFDTDSLQHDEKPWNKPGENGNTTIRIS